MPATIQIPTTRPSHTLTVSAFPDGSDTVSPHVNGTSLTEATNRPGVYSFENSAATGLHLLILRDDDSPVWQCWAVLKTDGTMTASETREAALLAQSISSDGQVALTSEDRDALLNAIGTPLQEGDYVSPPSAGTISHSVWSASTRTLTGIEIDPATFTDSISTAVETVLSDAALTAGDVEQLRYQLGLDGAATPPVSATPQLSLTLSTAALQQLVATKQIRISLPTLMGNELSQPLVQGDNYSAALGSAIEFSRSDFPDLPTGTTCRLAAQGSDCLTPGSFELTGTIVTASETKVLRFEATSAQSSLWTPGRYEFQVDVTFPGGEVRSFVGPNALLRVLAKLEAA